jgi:hypothetical protein
VQRTTRTGQILQSIARLKPGQTVQQAAAEITGIGARLEKLYPNSNKNRRFVVWPALRFIVDYETHQYLIMLLGSVAFVLLIACANVANLQFARATGRLREVAVRRALGASRARIVTQLLTESVLLSIAAAGLGLLIARWGLRMMRNGMPPEIQRYIPGAAVHPGRCHIERHSRRALTGLAVFAAEPDLRAQRRRPQLFARQSAPAIAQYFSCIRSCPRGRVARWCEPDGARISLVHQQW